MFNKCRAFLIASVTLPTLLLTACSHPPKSPLPDTGISPEQKQCATRCITQQTNCNRQHQKLYQQCVVNAKQQAKQHWQIYATSRQQAHQKVDRSVQDFLNLSHCDQQLRCQSDYKVCYDECGL